MSRGLGDVYKRQRLNRSNQFFWNRSFACLIIINEREVSVKYFLRLNCNCVCIDKYIVNKYIINIEERQMSKKKIDKDTVINRGQYSIVKIVMLNIIGGIFVLIGAKLVSICIEMVAEVIKKGESFNATVLLPMVIGLLFGLFGGIALFFAWKDVYHWRKKKIARECGEDGFAVIIDYYSISEGSKSGMNINRYYGFVLSLSLIHI